MSEAPARPWKDAQSDAVRVRRAPERGRYDRATADAILDEALVCHVATIDDDGRPLVIPNLHARIGDDLYLHGSAASRNLRRVASGVDVCVEVALVDGLVLAHSVFNHSVNYRSVVVRGRAVAVEGRDELVAALRAFTEKLAPGRWDEAVGPSEQDLKATTVMRLPIVEFSAKARSGDPGHIEEEHHGTDIWCGVVPLRLVASAPVTASLLRPGIPVSPAALAFAAAHGAEG